MITSEVVELTASFKMPKPPSEEGLILFSYPNWSALRTTNAAEVGVAMP
jgi:hypothetical protein